LATRASVLCRRIRELAADSENIVWTDHIQEQMEKRGIDVDAVMRILTNGDPAGEPVQGKREGDWKIKLTRKLRVGREAGVVTVVVKDRLLILVTTEWEDLR